MRPRPALLLVLSLLIAAAPLAACDMPFARKPAGDQVLRLLLPTGRDPDSLDPHLTRDAASAELIVEIFSGLVALNDKLQVVPDLAAKWDVSPDGRTYTFTLKKGLKFQDGKEVKADDVKYSLERALDPRTHPRNDTPVSELYLGDVVGAADKLAGRASEVSGVRVKDPSTVEITIDQPKAYFLAKLTYPTAFVVDKANVETGRLWWERPNGTGPFRVKEWRRDERLVLARNDNYYDTKPTVAEVEFLPPVALPVAMYEQGLIDIAPVTVNEVERVTDKGQPLYKDLKITSELSVSYIGLNVLTKPFDDPKVREAFNRAIDKDRIINVVLKKMHTRADGILPPGLPGYNDKLKALTYDVSRARQLIAESSYRRVENFPEITLHVYGRSGTADRHVLAIVDMLRQNLGVDVKIAQTDFATFIEEIARGRTSDQMFTLGWIADYPDPQNFLDILFYSQSGDNHTNYGNPEVDRLLERARTEKDTGTRLHLYQEAEQLIVAEAPWIPLWHPRQYTLVKPYVQGYSPAPVVLPWLKQVRISGRPAVPERTPQPAPQRAPQGQSA